jgi:hypothetical protein
MMATEESTEPKAKRKRPLDKKHRDTRTALILQSKLAGKRILEIADEFNISKATVHRALNDAEKMGLLAQARDWLSLKAIPLSLAAIEEALVLGDIPTKVDTAFRVLDGLGVTGKHAVLTIEQGKGAESFEEFRSTVVRRITRPFESADQAAATSDAADECPAILDGQLLPAPPSPADPGTGDRQDRLAGPNRGDSVGSANPVADALGPSSQETDEPL